MKVWLDDERPAPDGWVGCRWPEEVIRLLETGRVEMLSLDHDLGEAAGRTGMDVLVWLEEQVWVHQFRPPRVMTVHSMNPVARDRMRALIRRIEDRRRRRPNGG